MQGAQRNSFVLCSFLRGRAIGSLAKARHPKDPTAIATLIALPEDKLLQRSFRISALAPGAIFGLSVQPSRSHAEIAPFDKVAVTAIAAAQ
jgi:hypothetical protein